MKEHDKLDRVKEDVDRGKHRDDLSRVPREAEHERKEQLRMFGEDRKLDESK